MSERTAADAPKTGSRQYHTDLQRGEVAEYIVLVGDPGRVAKVASRFDTVDLERRIRLRTKDHWLGGSQGCLDGVKGRAQHV